MAAVMAPTRPYVEGVRLKNPRPASDALVTLLMYLAKHDDVGRVALWRFRGDASPAEWARHLADIDAVASWSDAVPRACVLIEVVDFVPTARQRSEIAAHSEKPSYRPLIALVTTNGLLRGTLRAISWLQGSRRYETEFFADTASALVWLESKSERSLSRLRRLHSQTYEDGVGTRSV